LPDVPATLSVPALTLYNFTFKNQQNFIQFFKFSSPKEPIQFLKANKTYFKIDSFFGPLKMSSGQRQAGNTRTELILL
jgi:hypothetical protein